jgi:hypothetical protein
MMLRHLVPLLLLTLSVPTLAQPATTTATSRPWTEWRNSLKPTGEASPAIEIARAGQPAAAILLPPHPSAPEQKAAEDLQHWLQQITGAKLPITRVPDPNQHYISLGQTDLVQERFFKALDPDAVQLWSRDGHLFLLGGGTRGIVNAGYALLEEDLGCRFYTNTSIKLPHDPNLKLSVVARAHAPQLRLRDPFYKVSFDPEWSLRNRTNAPDAAVSEDHGGHIDYGGLFVHTQHTLLPPDKYFKDHPDYYQMNPDGKRVPLQLCTTNADVRRLVTDAVLETLKKNPHTEVVSVSRLDIQQVCHCPDCNKLRDAEGSEMANQLLLVNQVAAAVEQAYPNVLVDTLAYLETLPVPKTMRPRKNVIIRLCNDVPGAWSHPFTPAEQTGTAAIASAWSKVHDRLSVWDYNVNFSHYLAPMPNVDVIAANIRYWIKNKAWGVMTQGGYQGAAERDELKSWVIAKLMWNPTLDEHELTQDFITGHYGPAAAPIAEYDALLVQAAKDHANELASPPGGIRYPMDAPFLSRDFLDRATTLHAHAKVLAGTDTELLHRVERSELPLLYVKLSRGPAFDPDFARTLADFSTIAHRERATHLAEVWPANLDPQIETWKKQIPPRATTQPISTTNRQSAIQNRQFQTLSQGPASLTYQAFPDLTRLKNGDLLAVFYAGYGHVSVPAGDLPNGGRICMTRSVDDGRSWSAPQVLFDDPDDNRDPHIAQLDDGTLVCTFFSLGLKPNTPPLKSSADFSWTTYPQLTQWRGTQLVTSHDNGHTWSTTATSIAKDWYCSAPVRQLKDGTCLLGVYKEGQEKAGDFTIAYGGVLRSTDRCKTWSAPIPIGKDAKLPLDAETDVIELNDGQLYAALRSSKVNMHYATSPDKGLTWTSVKDIGFPAHAPHLYRLSSGEILLSHRLPHTALHISRDDAKTWQGPYEIDTVIGAYPSCVELTDHSVLITYYTEGQGSQIRAKRFRLTPDGPEFLPP